MEVLMRSAREDHAAVRVPGHGILPVGGAIGLDNCIEHVELLQLSGDDEDVTSWLQPKRNPFAPTSYRNHDAGMTTTSGGHGVSEFRWRLTGSTP